MKTIVQAIIYIMLGNNKQAKKCWEDFKSIQRNFQWPPSLEKSQVEAINHFKQFEEVVKFLKDDIRKSQAQRMAQN